MKDSTYTHRSGDTNEPAKARPQALNTFAIAQAHTLLKPRIVSELTRPLMGVRVHSGSAEFDALERGIRDYFVLYSISVNVYDDNVYDLLCLERHQTRTPHQ